MRGRTGDANGDVQPGTHHLSRLAYLNCSRGPTHVHDLSARGDHTIQRFRESLKKLEITNDSAASGNEDLAFAYISSHGLFAALDQPDARVLQSCTSTSINSADLKIGSL